MTLTCPCGAELVVAGCHARIHGTRPEESGRVPSDGRCRWGTFACHQCGAAVQVPPVPETVLATDRG